MTKNPFMLITVLLNVIQIIFVIYFLAKYSTDNAPLFMLLTVVPLANLAAIFLIQKRGF
jgi:hypothetical protein